jgi:sugar fermentation stimulation protein A
MRRNSPFGSEEKGVYTILVSVGSSAFIDVGRLGRFEFSGLYAYTGSAQGRGSSSLRGRVSRHLGLRSKKRVRWHIDYLLAHSHTQVEGVALSATIVKSKECQVSRNIFSLAESLPPVTGFGSSDCSCKSHLARLKGEPKAALSTIMRAHKWAGLKPRLICNVNLPGRMAVR